MLNQNDRRRLEEIERRLRAEDPEFARRFTQVPPRPNGRSRFWPVLMFIVGVLGTLTSLLAPLPAVFVLSAAATATGWIWLRRLDQRDAGPKG